MAITFQYIRWFGSSTLFPPEVHHTESTNTGFVSLQDRNSQKVEKEKWGQLICHNSGDYIHILQKDKLNPTDNSDTENMLC